MTTLNNNLNSAKCAKNDEFYTRIEDVVAELYHYRDHFQDKTVYLNCDDQSSAFWQYFSGRFDDLGLRRLVATKYPDGLQFRQDRDKGLQVIQLTGDGDFRSEECVELLKQSDIVVTNPPFSLFREYVAQLVEHDKKFVILGNMNAITYKEVWPLIKSNDLWLGSSHFNTGMYFKVPRDFAYGPKYKFAREIGGDQVARVAGIAWFTNLEHKKRHEELYLDDRRYVGHEDEYPTYDNYDAIEVSRVKDIPEDYDGVMGVPITFLDKWNPEQFELVDHMIPILHGITKYKRVLIRRVI